MFRRTKRLEQKRIVDLTPMIDVIFLLVIFFMTSSTMIKIKSLKIDLPEAAAADQDISKPSVFSIDQNGAFYLDGKEVPLAQVEDALKKLKSEKESKILLVEGYKNLPYQKIVEVMSLAKKAGIEKVSLSVKSGK